MREESTSSRPPSIPRALLVFAAACALLALLRFEGMTIGGVLVRPIAPLLDPRLQRHAGWVLAHVVLLFAAPLVLARIGLQQKPETFGLGLGDARRWGTITLGLLPLVVIGAAILSHVPGVAAHYRAHTAGISGLFGWFGWITMWGAAFFAWEFFFRGLLVVGLARDLGGPAAIVLHLLPFTLVHVGKPALEVLLTVPGGLVFGALAFRGRSMLGPFLLHWTLGASLDLFVARSVSALPSLASGG
ncbi:CPBP family intramembrane glutamic endopeptidase [Polyangium sp. y55x31]|uniref:CPBP family intramembrane glutamic endopeptidase n=1 Tax=Polyangium sp. y55x31 TaxID=3042688 RepID=UPI002482E051|nr:CPBP family intramembrane glutamic endopeptidase [Polyangium sp. y55x31]MDI1481383.1 CPBP family intramembrane metalloprotease [Polyangium sp. y55x31]